MIKTSLEIRPANAADVYFAMPLVKEFVSESVEDYGFHIDPDVALAQFQGFTDNAVVAYDGEKMIGVLAGKVAGFELSGQQIFQEGIWFVSKEYRRVVGPKLLTLMETMLREKGIGFCVMVHLGNKGAEVIKRYYNGLGYRLMETHYLKKL